MNNSNVLGGAIYLENVENARIYRYCKFLGNTAAQSGGAIYFSCSNYGLDFSKCSLQINSSTFVNNSADIEGGAIKWNFYEPKMFNL